VFPQDDTVLLAPDIGDTKASVAIIKVNSLSNIYVTYALFSRDRDIQYTPFVKILLHYLSINHKFSQH